MNELGKYLRKFRIDENQLSLKDMAEKLGVSTSLLSAYETGRREIPDVDSFYKNIVESFSMTEKNSRKLRKALDKTLNTYRVDLSQVNPDVRDRYVEFARKLDTFTLEDFERLGIKDEEE